MKTLLIALVALSTLVRIAAPANAADLGQSPPRPVSTEQPE
jgi:hypothetical protein